MLSLLRRIYISCGRRWITQNADEAGLHDRGLLFPGPHNAARNGSNGTGTARRTLSHRELG
jgi:hypothetical protein